LARSEVVPASIDQRPRRCAGTSARPLRVDDILGVDPAVVPVGPLPSPGLTGRPTGLVRVEFLGKQALQADERVVDAQGGVLVPHAGELARFPLGGKARAPRLSRSRRS
jgi:hypothetical protein